MRRFRPPAIILPIVVLVLAAQLVAACGGTAKHPRATMISAGRYSTCALLANGRIKCWGFNKFGELGNGRRQNSTIPVEVSGITNARAISNSLDGTCAVLARGRIKCWGFLSGNRKSGGFSLVPVYVRGIANARQVSASGDNTCAVLATGAVDCWGDSDLTGNAKTFDSPTPVRVMGIERASQISVGGVTGQAHACAVLAGGAVKCWGSNNFRELGAGTKEFIVNTPVTVRGISTATQVSAGQGQTCALLSSGTVKCWGGFLLGNGTDEGGETPVRVSGIRDAIAISAGIGHVCALLSSGKVKCWGGSNIAELANGTRGPFTRPIPVAIKGIEKATAISAGYSHFCAIISGGKVECWGMNPYGQLGDGKKNRVMAGRIAPVPVVGLH